jgi:hypothetical protein
VFRLKPACTCIAQHHTSIYGVWGPHGMSGQLSHIAINAATGSLHRHRPGKAANRPHGKQHAVLVMRVDVRLVSPYSPGTLFWMSWEPSGTQCCPPGSVVVPWLDIRCAEPSLQAPCCQVQYKRISSKGS